MKIAVLLLSAFFALSYALPPPLHDGGKVHIPEKCEDVLAVKVCNNLKTMALRLKLKAEDVTKAVVDAVKKGKTTSIEIYDAAKDFLMSEVLAKKCEDFTTPENCEKLRKVAAVLKVNAVKLEAFVVKAVAEGAVQAKEIYAKVMEYYKNEIVTKKCEDFLSASQCAQLRSIAAKLKVKFDDLEDAIKDAYLETLGDAKAMFSKVVATLKNYALNTKCEDLLNPDLCTALRRYAELTKVKLPVLLEKAVDLLIKGYDVSKSLLKGIYKIVDTFYDCEDVFDKSSCDKLYKAASYLGLAHQKVEEFLKKYIPIAVETGKDIINDFPGFMKDLTQFLKEEFCKITPLCLNADEVDLMFSNDPIFDFDAIRQKIRKYIDEHYPQVQQQIKQKVHDILNKAQSVSQLIQEAATEMILVTGESAETIRAILKDLISNIKSIVYPSVDAEYIANDILDIETIKQKLREYINKKYPGLEEKVKQKVTDVINKAKSVSDLLVQAAKEIFLASGDAADKIKAIFMELVDKVKGEILSDETMYKRDLSFESLKQKVLDYINKKYPGLEEKVKQKVTDVVNKANSVSDLLVQAAKEIFLASGDAADKIKAIFMELVDKVKGEILSDETMYKRDLSFESLKQKVLDYINKNYPGLEEKVKQKVTEVINKAKSVSNLLVDATKEILLASGDAADEIKAVFIDLVKKLKEEVLSDEVIYA